jgi:hypothetical protein
MHLSHLCGTLAAAFAIAALQPAAAAPPVGVTYLGAPPALPHGVALSPRPPARQVWPNVDTDVAGRQPFQAHVDLNVNAPVAAIAIPAGKRLIVDHIAVTGAAASNSGPIQPVLVLYATQPGTGQVDYLYQLQPSALVSTQFSLAQQATIYADSFAVGEGFSGYTPSFLVMGITVSGHLITP